MDHCYNHLRFDINCYQCRNARDEEDPSSNTPDVMSTMLAAEVAMSSFSTPDGSPAPVDVPSSDFSGFDGGSSGGGGASGDFS